MISARMPAIAGLLLASGCAGAPVRVPTLLGYVMDANRVPIANARVQVGLAENRATAPGAAAGVNAPEAIQISDLGGTFHVEQLGSSAGSVALEAERSYRVVVEEPDYRMWEGVVAYGGGIHEMEIELEPVLDQIEDTRPIDPDAADPIMEGQVREGT